MNKVYQILQWTYFVSARKVLGLLPWRAAVGFGAFGGDMTYRLRFRRSVVLENLALAFPEMSPAERRRLARQVFRNAGRGTIEGLLLPDLPSGAMNDLVEGIEGFEPAKQLLAAGKSIIVLTGHLGNWELMGAYFASQGYRLKVFAKPLHNPLLESDLLAARRKIGLDVFYIGQGLKPAMRHLRENGVLVFLADQDARREGIPVPFFGKPASTALGPAVFSYLARVPIFPAFAIRVGPTRHRFLMLPPIEPRTGEPREVALERLTRAHVEVLEQVIRQYPDQYFWFHRRWKTPPHRAEGLKERD